MVKRRNQPAKGSEVDSAKQRAWFDLRAMGIGVVALVFAATPAGARYSPDEIARWVKQLGHPRYELRQGAEEALVRIGVDAIPALRDAMNHPLPEIRHRARRSLQAITSLTPQQRNVKRKEAQKAFKAGDFQTTRQRYAHIAMADSAEFQDLLWLGHANQLLDDWDGAIRAYKRSLHIVDRTYLKALNVQLHAEQQRQLKEAGVGPQRAAIAEVRAFRRIKVMKKQMRAQHAYHVRRRASFLLLIGRIQRDVLNDFPAAVRSFADGANGIRGATEQIPDLIAEHLEPEADRDPSPPSTQLLYPLMAMRELAETQTRLGRIDEAIDAWNRYNLISLFNASRPSLQIQPIAHLATKRDPTIPMPPIAGVTVMSDRNARVTFDLGGPGAEARAYESSVSASGRSWRFAMMPETGLEFDTFHVACEFERTEPHVDGRVRCWGMSGPKGKRHALIGDITWPPGVGEDRKINAARFEVPAGLEVAHLEAVQRNEAFKLHRVTVNATFRPRMEHAESPESWAHVRIETLPEGGILQRNGEHVVHGGLMPLKPGTHEFRYAMPGHRQEIRTQLAFEAGQRYGLLINLDSPFQSQVTNLRRFGRSYSADPNLVRLVDGRWLVAFCRDYRNILISTSDDGVRWDEPLPLPFNAVCQTIAPSLFVDDDRTIWLAYFSNRLELESAGSGGYRLWLTSTRDGRDWSVPRPLEIGGFGGWPVGSVRLARHPDGRYWMFWRDLAGSAESLDELTGLMTLGLNRKHKLDVRSPHVTIDRNGVFHMAITNRRREIRYCRSTDGRQWSEPQKLVEDVRAMEDAQLFVSGNRAALLYETRDGSFLRRGTIAEAPVLGDPIKIAHRSATLFGSKAHLTPDGDMLILAGQDTIWLMRAKIKDVLSGEE